MGSKEENLATRQIFGFSGKMRPLQTVGGACTVCHCEVWINLPASQATFETEYTHYACHNQKYLASRSRESNGHVANALIPLKLRGKRA